MHFAAIPRVLIEPDNATFAANVVSTYNVIEAAMKLGVRKVVIASSETTYGVCFAEGDKDFHSFPLEEDYDVDPMDSYGLSKVCNEKTARAFAMRYGADIYALRIGNVIEPHEYGQFEAFLANPMMRKRNAWSYIDARDLGEIVHLCLEKDGLGFQVFNAVNDTITLNTPTREFLAAALSARAGHAPARRIRGAAVEPQGARSVGIQGGARLAPLRARRLDPGRRGSVAVLLDARRAQAGEAELIDRHLPAQEFVDRQGVSRTGLFEREQAAAHRGDDFGLAADDPTFGRGGRQIRDRQRAAVGTDDILHSRSKRFTHFALTLERKSYSLEVYGAQLKICLSARRRN